MKISERGQITIPKQLREQFDLRPFSDVEFVVEQGHLLLRKKSAVRRLKTSKWIGYLKGNPDDIDQFLEDARGR